MSLYRYGERVNCDSHETPDRSRGHCKCLSIVCLRRGQGRFDPDGGVTLHVGRLRLYSDRSRGRFHCHSIEYVC